GPRPELPCIVEQYEPWQRRRLSVPPGITGWWQISGRADRPMHLHTEDDLYYIKNYSLWLDLHILIKTIGAVIRGRGAY
ncbi:MAG: sugar transferase, partial [Anaerolineae bacterium]|nr:sugar transferase [Anaerolineae bacterium]